MRLAGCSGRPPAGGYKAPVLVSASVKMNSSTSGKRCLHRPSRVAGELTLREASFVQFYVGETRGNGRRATHLAGYQGNAEVLDVQAARLLRRPRVREAIAEALRAETEFQKLNKDSVVKWAYQVLKEERPFERVRALQLLAKLLGYLAPARKETDREAHRPRSSSYRELAATLQERSDSFTSEDRASIRQTLLHEIGEIQRCLEILDSRKNGR